MTTLSTPRQEKNGRMVAVLAILVIALVAFEIFNFDTTRFALSSLLGDVEFMGMTWASILAVAFCGIDFAGLIRIFSSAEAASKESAYLMTAWLLGATMNAVMTWWAVSLTLLENSIGNEVLSREALLTYVPVFVATLVWLTRILFIGSMSAAGQALMRPQLRQQQRQQPRQRRQRVPVNATQTQPRQPLVMQERPASVPAAQPVQTPTP